MSCRARERVSKNTQSVQLSGVGAFKRTIENQLPMTLTAAVIGCGGAGRNHASGYDEIDDVDLVGVCDLELERAQSLADAFGCPAFTTVDELLADASPDIVSVATPERHHVDPVLAALDAGADVFCEKIMAHSMAAGRELADAAQRAEGWLAVDYNYRHMPTFARVQEAITTDEIGEVHLATAQSHAFGWHHTLDLIRFLLGEPTSVQATLRHDPDRVADRHQMDDLLYVPSHAVAATFEFPSGSTASVTASIHTDLDNHLIDLAVYGEAGRVGPINMTPSDSKGAPDSGVLVDELQETASITLDESFRRSVAAFVEAIRQGDEPPTTWEDGLAVMELEAAVLDAAETGQRVAL